MNLDEEIHRLVAEGTVLVGTDFDGTLAPIVEHPDLAAPDARARALLETLAGRNGIEVAVVSGRALADLRLRLGDIPGVTLVGEHGNDLGADSPTDPLIVEATTMIGGLAAEADGATVETKSNSVTFHYRMLDEGTAAGYLEQIRRWADQHETVSVLEGKKVIEVTTSTRNKGDAIADLAGTAGVIFMGDDVTDETVFVRLRPGDIGVKVGEGPTAASHRVKDIDGVVNILEEIALASR